MGDRGPTPVLLWVRAGSDGIRNGADPACQQMFMVLLRKTADQSLAAAGQNLVFNVRTVNLAKPPPEFREHGLRHCPALVQGEEVLDLPDEILEYIDTRWVQPPLQYFDPEADDAVADLFSKFCFYIKEVNKDPKGLETELRRLNEHLLENGTRFLTGDVICHLDCRILPYLHHIRIAAQGLKGYTIPVHLRGVWSYLGEAYKDDVFIKSCPSDQEILLYWAERKDTPNFPPAKGLPPWVLSCLGDLVSPPPSTLPTMAMRQCDSQWKRGD